MNLDRRQFVKGAAVVGAGAALGLGTLSGCASTQDGSGAQEGNEKISVTVPGFNGDVTVEMNVDAESGAVSDVNISGPYETVDRGGRAISKMMDAMNESGSIEVDAVTGATVTSTAVLDAAAHARAIGMSQTAAEDAAMASGTYEASSFGHYAGKPVSVSVTVSENSIDSVEISDDDQETVLMKRAVVDKYIPRMLESQALCVDVVTGATMTSSAVRLAVEQCLKQAYEASGAGDDAVFSWLKRADVEPSDTEHIEKDVVVIGLGGAGMATALSAAENGLSVLAIDKAGKYGGTTCVTSESMAVNPQRFRDEKNNGADFVDSAALYADWKERAHDDAKEDMLQLFFDESGNTIDWLNYEHDWPYNVPGKGHADYAVFDCCFQYTPYTLSGPKAELADTIDILMGEYEKAGGEYLLEVEAYDFLTDEASGAVTGVKARGFDDKEYEIGAHAVVLATGGFGENSSLMEKYMIDDYYPLSGTWHQYGMSTNDGVMIERALDLGAGTCNPSVPPLSHLAGFPVNLTGFGTHEKDEVSFFTGKTAIWSEGDIPSTLSVAADSLAVTREGERFINEEGFATHEAIKAGPEYYTIWSQEQLDVYKTEGLSYADPGPSMGYVGCQSTIPLGVPLEQLDDVMNAGIDLGYIFKADTLDDLANAAGMEASVLKSTVDAYNACCDAGVDDQFGKDPQYLKRIGDGPYYAVLGCSFYYTTGGALDVNANMQVLADDGETPIEGLYAVGTDSMGVLMSNQEQYLDYGGAASGWAFTSGRIAGRAIAETIG